tara:strand:+ start:305 stop:454 length:150 start_codon:yes stop_codon:yes gene_type:complete
MFKRNQGKHMNDNEDISLFAIVPEGLTKDELMEWMDNLTEADFKPLIID